MEFDDNLGYSAEVQSMMWNPEVESHFVRATEGMVTYDRHRVEILGDARVGKTSLKRLLVEQRFCPDEEPTDGVEHSTVFVESTPVGEDWKVTETSIDEEAQEMIAFQTVKNFLSRCTMQTLSQASRFFLVSVLFLQVYNMEMLLGFCDDKVAFLLCMMVWYLETTLFSGPYMMADVQAFVLLLLKASTLPFACARSTPAGEYAMSYSCLICMTAFWFVYGVSIGCRLLPGLFFAFVVMHPGEQVERQCHAFLFNMNSVSFMATAFILFYSGNKLARGLVIFLPFFLFAVQVIPTCFLLGSVWCIVFVMGAHYGLTLLRNKEIVDNIQFLLIQYSVGFCFGIFVGKYVMAWKFLDLATISDINVQTFVMIGIPSAMNLSWYCGFLPYRLRTCPFPVLKIRELIRKWDYSRRCGPAKTKLNISDYAGQVCYYDAHQLFLAKEAVYVVVFNIVEAARDLDWVVKRLIYWLTVIKMRANNPCGRVFVVGTHRNCVPSDIGVDSISTALHTRLYDQSKYVNMFVVNRHSNSIVFAVENSLPLDEEGLTLRQMIWETAVRGSSDYRIPVRWLGLLRERLMSTAGQVDHFVCDLETVLEQSAESFDLQSFEQYKTIVELFHVCGDIICQTLREGQTSKTLIIDPRSLAEATRALRSIPQEHERNPEFAEDWRLYKTRSILRAKLLSHILEEANFDENSASMLVLLLQHNCIIAPGCTQHAQTSEGSHDCSADCSGRFYLVPSMLPSAPEGEFWRPKTDDRIFCFNFEAFNPEFVFTRLIAKCQSGMARWTDNTKHRPTRSAARFCFHMHVFMIQLFQPVPEQNLIKVTLRRRRVVDSFHLYKCLYEYVEDIVDRDFPNLDFTCGFPCSLGDHPDLSEDSGSRVHILQIASRGVPFPSRPTAYHLPIMCGDVRCVVDRENNNESEVYYE
ncbi:uncharacterized protein [Ptychodera flava]|uniref:uncharacterized protein n=1 Tax=Ptychodera flava TaxID=63121 RepID=UPI00396AA0E8